MRRPLAVGGWRLAGDRRPSLSRKPLPFVSPANRQPPTAN